MLLYSSTGPVTLEPLSRLAAGVGIDPSAVPTDLSRVDLHLVHRAYADTRTAHAPIHSYTRAHTQTQACPLLHRTGHSGAPEQARGRRWHRPLRCAHRPVARGQASGTQSIRRHTYCTCTHTHVHTYTRANTQTQACPLLHRTGHSGAPEQARGRRWHRPLRCAHRPVARGHAFGMCCWCIFACRCDECVVFRVDVVLACGERSWMGPSQCLLGSPSACAAPCLCFSVRASADSGFATVRTSHPPFLENRAYPKP